MERRISDCGIQSHGKKDPSTRLGSGANEASATAAAATARNMFDGSYRERRRRTRSGVGVR